MDDAFPSGLVTATPPTPLLRRGGGGARTCATQRSTRRVARKGVGFGVRVRRRRQASPVASLHPASNIQYEHGTWGTQQQQRTTAERTTTTRSKRAKRQTTDDR
eukprot:scaffold5918_cov124-Isochrysis_galbana.AAC.9